MYIYLLSLTEEQSTFKGQPFHTILFCIDEEECDQRKKNASKKQRPKDSSSTETKKDIRMNTENIMKTKDNIYYQP
jgi:hypothetical protein